MKRRSLLATASLSGFAGSSIAQGGPSIRWRMPSSFPKTLDSVYGAGQEIAETVRKLTDGKFNITTHGPGELVPPLAVLDSVQTGTVECGHTAGFYYVGKESALVFDTGVPFGMTPRQHNAWMSHGGGLELMRGVYDKFNTVQIPCGGTGAQMGGWFRKEIKSVADLKGLRMRVPGLLGKVYAKLGAIPTQVPGSDVYPALEKGVLDAAEFVGPADDEKLGIAKVAKFYYAPGVMELNASLCMLINKKAWAELPESYRFVLEVACAQAGANLLAKYDVSNFAALKRLVASGVKLSFWPRPVMVAMQAATREVLIEESAANPAFATVYAKWRLFLDEQQTWSGINDGAAEQFLLNTRLKT